MKKNRLIIIYIIAILSDFSTTYFTTPDLNCESNWIVKYYDKGWVGLIIINIISAVVVISLYKFYKRNPFSIKSYISSINNTFNIRNWSFSRNNIKTVISIVGFLFIRGMIISTFIVAISNLLQGLYKNNIIVNAPFQAFIKLYLIYRNILGFDLLYVLFTLIFISICLYYYRYFKRSIYSN